VAIFGVGALISADGATARAWQLAFAKLHGIPVSVDGLAGAGLTDGRLARIAFIRALGRQPTTGELGRLSAKRLEYLPQVIADSAGYRILPGVEALLERLAGERLPLGITSGGLERAVKLELGPSGLTRYFSFGGYGSDSDDRSEVTKRAIDRAGVDAHRCVVVGDTPIDVRAARDARAVAMGVASGRFGVDELADAGADHVVHSLEDGLPV
jgi:phosphoglycolate phosphatase-like HAD superfamily hydrolase